MALCLLLSLTPMEVLAQEPAQAEEQLLAEAVLLEEPEVPADDIPADAPEADISPLADTEIVLSGTCGAEGDGSNLRWEFDLDKRTFTITGSGAMKDYAHASAMPWYSAAYNHRNDEDRFDIIVGEGITSIGSYAFSCFSYSGIASLSLPSTLEKIGGFACSGITTGLTELVLPEKVTYIGDSAFRGCNRLEQLVIKNPGFTCGSGVFYLCSSLTDVTLPEGMSAIPDQMFVACPFSEIHLPDSITSIGASSFEQTSLAKIDFPSGLVSIGEAAFRNCKNLAGPLNFPDSLQSIGGSAFRSCSGVTGFNWPKSLQSVGNDAFIACGLTGHLTIPDGVTFGDYVFNDCASLTSVTLPKSEKLLGGRMLDNCNGLTSISIPSTWTSIPDRMFEACNWMTSIVLPDSIETIGNGAFSYCESLVICAIPDGVTSIGYDAFRGCGKLSSFLVIPASVTSIQYGAFADSGLRTVRFLGDAPDDVRAAKDSNFYMRSTFPVDAVLYYTAGKEGWTTPTWLDYSAYVILGEGSYEFHDADYYASLALRNFDFQAHLGPHQGEGVKNVTLSYQRDTISANEGESSISAAIRTEPYTEILFTQANMYDVSLPVEVLSTFNTIQFHPKTGIYPATKPFVQAIYGRTVGEEYTDLLHQRLTLYAGSFTEKTGLYIDVNWLDQSEGKLYLSQTLDPDDGVEVQAGFNDPKNISFKLKADKPLYLLMVCDDDNNTVLSQQLSVSILTENKKFDMDLGEGVEPTRVSASQNEFLSEFSFDVDLPKDISVTLSVKNDGSVKALLGVKLAKESDEDAVFDTIQDALVYSHYEKENCLDMAGLEHLLKSRGAGVTIQRSSMVVNGSASLLGCAEGHIICYENGQYGIVLSKGTVGISFAGGVTQTFQMYAYSVPFYISGSISPKVTFNITLRSTEKDTALLVDPIDGSGAIALKVAGGLGWDSIASAGIYGSGSGTLKFQIPWGKNTSSCSFQGSIGAEATFFNFSSDLTIFETDEIYLWGESTRAAFSRAALEQADWQPQSRQYLGTAPELGISLLTIDEENTVLTSGLVTDEGLYPYAAVQTVALSGSRQVAVWTDDPGTRSDNNRTVLYYSYYDGSAWSAPAPVEAEDDGTADFNPKLKVLNDTAYLVWQDAVRALTSSDTPDTTPALMDISCAVFNAETGAFTTLGTVGTEYYDTTADVVLLNGQPAVVWTSNSGNSALNWSGATYSLHRQVPDGGGDMETLAGGLYQVDGLAADGGEVWFSADTDGDSETLADREIFHYDGSALERLTNNDAADTKPALTGGRLAWYSGGTVVCGGNTVALAADTDRYQYVRSDTGMEAVVYLEDDEVRKTTLYASFNDGSGWGDPIALTGTTGNIGSFSAVFLSDGTLCITACERGLDDSQKNYLSTGAASLKTYSVTPYCDLAIERVSYLEQSLVKGGTLDVPVQVVNNGMANAELMEIQVLSGDTQVASSMIGASLASGQSNTFYVSVLLGDAPADYKDLTVTVSAAGYTERTEADNSAPLTLRLSDVSVEGAAASSDGAATQVKALVVNRGQTDLSGLTVHLYDEDGTTVLATQTVAALPAGEGAFVTFQVNQSFANNTLLTVEAAVDGLAVTEENIASNNTYTALVKGPKAAALTVYGSAITGEDEKITVIASVSNTTDQAQTCDLFVAAYSADGRMLAAQTVRGVQTESGAVSSEQVRLTASGASIIRMFALDANSVPLTAAAECSI